MKTRVVYIEMMESQLNKWSAQLDEAQMKSEKMGCEKCIRALRDKIEEVQVKLKDLRMKESSDDAWEDLKKSFEKGMFDLKGALDNAVSKFK